MTLPFAKLKHVLLLLAAILLMACDQQSDSSVGSTSPARTNLETSAPIVESTVIVTDQSSGNFILDARSNGATFLNQSGEHATFVFKAEGQWSFAHGAGPLGPSGANSPAPQNFLLPGANSFGLVAKRGDGGSVYVGDGSELTLAPDELASFAMNDITGGLTDNRGSLKIEWYKRASSATR